jgi:hypothetical protein
MLRRVAARAHQAPRADALRRAVVVVQVGQAEGVTRLVREHADVMGRTSRVDAGRIT